MSKKRTHQTTPQAPLVTEMTTLEYLHYRPWKKVKEGSSSYEQWTLATAKIYETIIETHRTYHILCICRDGSVNYKKLSPQFSQLIEEMRERSKYELGRVIDLMSEMSIENSWQIRKILSGLAEWVHYAEYTLFEDGWYEPDESLDMYYEFLKPLQQTVDHLTDILPKLPHQRTTSFR